MHYLCNFNNRLLTSGTCAWRVGLPWLVGANLIESASTDGGGAGRRMAGGWRVKWLRETEIFVYPTKISVSRICFFYLP